MDSNTLCWFKFTLEVSALERRYYEALCVREGDEELLIGTLMRERALAWKAVQPATFHRLAGPEDWDFLWTQKDKFPYEEGEACVLLCFNEKGADDVYCLRWSGGRWVSSKRRISDVWSAERAYVLF